MNGMTYEYLDDNLVDNKVIKEETCNFSTLGTVLDSTMRKPYFFGTLISEPFLVYASTPGSSLIQMKASPARRNSLMGSLFNS
jgi:hypothetical protein